MEGKILKLPWARGTSSKKGHGGLPREREISWVKKRKKEEKKCVKRRRKD